MSRLERGQGFLLRGWQDGASGSGSDSSGDDRIGAGFAPVSRHRMLRCTHSQSGRRRSHLNWPPPMLVICEERPETWQNPHSTILSGSGSASTAVATAMGRSGMLAR